MKRWHCYSIVWGNIFFLLSVGAHAATVRTVVAHLPASLVSVAVSGERALVVGESQAWWYTTDKTNWQQLSEFPASPDVHWLRGSLADVNGDGRVDVLLSGVGHERAITTIFLQSAPDQWTSLPTAMSWYLIGYDHCPSAVSALLPKATDGKSACFLGQARGSFAVWQGPIVQFSWDGHMLQPGGKIRLPSSAKIFHVAPVGPREWAIVENSGVPRYCQVASDRCEWLAQDYGPVWPMRSATNMPPVERALSGGRDDALLLLPLLPWCDAATAHCSAIQQQPIWNAVIGQTARWRSWELLRQDRNDIGHEEVLIHEAGALMDFVPTSAHSGIAVEQSGRTVTFRPTAVQSQIVSYVW